MVGIFELKPLIETNCFRSVKYVSNHLFDFHLFCNDQYIVINSTKGLLKINKYITSKLPSSRAFVIDSVRLRSAQELKNVVESQIAGHINLYFSRNHKFCYTSAFPRFYQDLIVGILVYSSSILILILFYELV